MFKFHALLAGKITIIIKICFYGSLSNKKYISSILSYTFLPNGALGCAILPKVLGLISDVDFPIPLPMNSSPSEKKSNLFHF